MLAVAIDGREGGQGAGLALVSWDAETQSQMAPHDASPNEELRFDRARKPREIHLQREKRHFARH